MKYLVRSYSGHSFYDTLDEAKSYARVSAEEGAKEGVVTTVEVYEVKLVLTVNAQADIKIIEETVEGE